MSLDQAAVRHVATLARIKVTDDELAPLAGELSNILHFVEQLTEVNTDEVAPMASVAHVNLPQRSDQVSEGGIPERVLANGPETAHGYFVVPKVVE